MKITKIVCHSSDGRMLSLYVEHPCNDVIVERREQKISDKGDVAFLNKFEDGSYSFGIIQGNYGHFGHSKGYIWSSRASVINQIFGTAIQGVAVRLPNNNLYFNRAFNLEEIKEILPKEWDFKQEQYDDGEIYHRLVYVGKSPIDYECGKTLYSAENEETNNNMVFHLNTLSQDTTI